MILLISILVIALLGVVTAVGIYKIKGEIEKNIEIRRTFLTINIVLLIALSFLLFVTSGTPITQIEDLDKGSTYLIMEIDEVLHVEVGEVKNGLSQGFKTIYWPNTEKPKDGSSFIVRNGKIIPIPTTSP